MVDKINSGLVSYILGIVSIVTAFFSPLAGIIFGIIGLSQSSKQKDAVSKKAKTLNMIGIIIGVIVLIISIIVAYKLSDGTFDLTSFPTQ
jgi:uncharacterized membrane protein YdcZ (DUF606 family)